MEKRISVIKEWLYEAGEKIKNAENKKLTIDQKTSRNDLVTNMDREIQAFLIDKIHRFNPEAKILAEEDGYSKVNDFTGQLFVIDPIDGTLNFVVERENFCIRSLRRW